MRRLGLFILLVATVGAGAILFHRRDEIQSVDDAVEVLSTTFQLDEEPPGDDRAALVPVRERDQARIRVAAFDLDHLDARKLDDESVMARIGQIVREFDVVAVQGLIGDHPSVLPRVLDWVNVSGGNYDVVASHPLGRGEDVARFAVFYDRSSIEVSLNQNYVVNDPDDLLFREPYVAWCRVRGPEPDTSFTFSLVTVDVLESEAEHEARWLGSVFEHVLSDGRGEDDVIMLGNFHLDSQRLLDLMNVSGMQVAITQAMTNTERTAQTENIVLSQPATAEFTGRAGVFDFYHHFNLTLDEATRISRHLPVWVELTLYEGGYKTPSVAAGSRSETSF